MVTSFGRQQQGYATVTRITVVESALASVVRPVSDRRMVGPAPLFAR
jgi:hypothetical protein